MTLKENKFLLKSSNMKVIVESCVMSYRVEDKYLMLGNDVCCCVCADCYMIKAADGVREQCSPAIIGT